MSVRARMEALLEGYYSKAKKKKGPNKKKLAFSIDRLVREATAAAIKRGHDTDEKEVRSALRVLIPQVKRETGLEGLEVTAKAAERLKDLAYKDSKEFAKVLLKASMLPSMGSMGSTPILKLSPE